MMAETLKKKNFLNNELFYQPLAFGFKKDDMFFNFSINTRVNQMLQFPSNFLDFRKGNYDPVKEEALPIDFSNLRIKADAYAEIALSASKELTPELTVGAGIKFLKGAASINTRKTDLLLTTKLDANNQAESITADVDFDIRTASIPYDMYYNDKGIIDSIYVDEKQLEENQTELFLFNGSWGVAFDLGATYQLTPEIQLSASALDLGFIRWKENTKQLTSSGSFTFSGLEIVPDEEGNFDMDTIVTLLTDSILDNLQISDVGETYSSATVPKLIIGGSYKLNDYFSAGAMLRADFYGKGPRLSSSISATASFAKRWQVTTSYSFMHNSYSNWGLGLSMNAGFFNFYLITDYVPVRLSKLTGIADDLFITPVIPSYAQTLNIRLGFNLLFGYKEKIDKPSIQVEDILKLE